MVGVSSPLGLGVEVTPSGSGFTADDISLGLHSRQHVAVGDMLISIRQGALHSCYGHSRYPEGCAYAQ